MKLSWKKIAPLIGVILFIYILSKLDFSELWQAIKRIDYRYFLVLPFTVVLILYLQTLKWQVLLKLQGFKIRFASLLKIHLISNYYAFITPSRIGYFTKIPYLQHILGGSLAKAGGSVIIDRILDILVLALFALVGSLLLLSYYPNVFVVSLILVLILIIIILFFYSKKRAKFFISFFKIFIPERFKDKLREIFNEFYDNFPAKKKLLIPVLLTLVVWLIAYSQMYIIALALSINISYWHFIILLPLSTVVSLLPITISGLGTREAVLILIFSAYNVSSESIVAMSLIGFVLLYYLPSFIGGFFSFKFFSSQFK